MADIQNSIFINLSKARLDVKFFCVRTPKLEIFLQRGMYGKVDRVVASPMGRRNPCFILVHDLLAIETEKILFLKLAIASNLNSMQLNHGTEWKVEFFSIPIQTPYSHFSNFGSKR